MIKENQKLLNYLNVLSDAAIVFGMLPLAFWIRFCVMPDGVVVVPLRDYLQVGVVYTLLQMFTYGSFNLYQPFRHTRFRRELRRLLAASFICMALLQSWLFMGHYMYYSRLTLGIYGILYVGALGCKRIAVRKVLWKLRERDYNQKHVLLIGSGPAAMKYVQEVRRSPELGYKIIGYISGQQEIEDLSWLGDYSALETVLDKWRPDEAISAIEPADFDRTPAIIDACEKTGVRLSIIPFYADYMPANPQFDDLNGVPLMNIRRIPLDNWGNAFCKRTMDIVGSALLLLLTSPVMLVCAIGVKLSSPGPVIFRQERMGLNKKTFTMYKFRSMRVNAKEKTGWSTNADDRKTKFGSFIRKFSLDELPQLWNVLKGDMSLVGPRPEVPFYVEQFKEEVPLYMVKHQVRPGITGWAQVNDFRGDTSIPERVKHDVYYIEHWNLLFDIKILLMTVFRGKFVNAEQM